MSSWSDVVQLLTTRCLYWGYVSSTIFEHTLGLGLASTRINQLIATQDTQQETLVHIISILNITRYATQVNKQYINIMMDAVERCIRISSHCTISCTPYTAASATTKLYPMPDPSWQISGILYTTWEKLSYTPWIILMQQLQEYSHCICYPLKTWGKCYYTLRKHFLPPRTYQFHQKIHYISTDI